MSETKYAVAPGQGIPPVGGRATRWNTLRRGMEKYLTKPKDWMTVTFTTEEFDDPYEEARLAMNIARSHYLQHMKDHLGEVDLKLWRNRNGDSTETQLIAVLNG